MKEGKVIAKKDITTAQNNYMGGIEPGTPLTTATLTYLARAKIGWMLDSLITNVDFTD